MSQIHPQAWWNGRLMPCTDVRLSPFQTGLLTGWGLFSTLRIYQGVPFALEDHLERLASDGQRLRMQMDGVAADIADGFDALIPANRAQEAMARVYCIRNRGGLLDVPSTRATDVLIFTAELRSWGATARLRVQPHGRHAAAPLAGTKTLTWSHNLVLVEAAQAAGFDDVLLLNERGEVAECTAANIFIVRDGRILTPPLHSGALPGVSRKALLAAAPRHGLAVEEAVLHEPDLYTADEIFISSSTREVQPVASIGAHDIPQGAMARRAEQALLSEVSDYVTARRTVGAGMK